MGKEIKTFTLIFHLMSVRDVVYEKIFQGINYLSRFFRRGYREEGIELEPSLSPYSKRFDPENNRILIDGVISRSLEEDE